MATISPAHLALLLTENPTLDIIDVRTPLEFGEVHVAAAKNLPLDSFSPKLLINDGTLSEDEPVYILCRSGQRATKAAEQFARDGFQNAIVVEGGTLAWIDAGLPVQNAAPGAKKIISLERQTHIAAGSLVLLGFLLGWLHPHFFYLSGFVGAGLIFAGITGWCGIGLIIAKAPWNK